MLKKITVGFFLFFSASIFAVQGSVMTLHFEKGTFVNDKDPTSTTGHFKLLEETAEDHDFAKKLILDFESKEAILTKANEKVCFGTFKPSEKNEILLQINFSKEDSRNTGCHNNNFTISSSQFTEKERAIRGQKFLATVQNVLFIGKVRAYFLRRV